MTWVGAVHYTGTLTDGTKFDSSVDKGRPFNFTIGVGQVIKGWDEGVIQMSLGEKAVLKITSDFGYGERGPSRRRHTAPPRPPALCCCPCCAGDVCGPRHRADLATAASKFIMVATLVEVLWFFIEIAVVSTLARPRNTPTVV